MTDQPDRHDRPPKVHRSERWVYDENRRLRHLIAKINALTLRAGDAPLAAEIRAMIAKGDPR